MKSIYIIIIALFGGASLLAQNVGVDQAIPVNKLDINGNLSVGSNYSGTFAAPANGAIFEGQVAVGTNTPVGILEVHGSDRQFSISIPNGNSWTLTHFYGNENFYLQRLLTGGVFDENVMVIDTIGRMGLKLGGSYSPQSDLHIKQSGWQTAGIRLEEASTTNNWVTYIHHSSGDYAFNYNGSFLAWIDKTDGTFSHVSDVRLKKDIQPMGSVLSKVLALNPTTYQFKTQPEEDHAISMGFISQEVEALFPNLVSEQNGIKGLKYSEFSVLAIKAIQEQQQIIDAQQSEIESLKDQLNKIISAMQTAGIKVNN